MSIDVKKWSGALTSPDLNNVGGGYNNLKEGNHLLLLTSLEEVVSKKGKGNFAVAKFVIAESESDTVGKAADLPFYLNAANFPMYEWAKLRAMIAGFLGKEVADCSSDDFQTWLTKASEGKAYGAPILVAVTTNQNGHLRYAWESVDPDEISDEIMAVLPKKATPAKTESTKPSLSKLASLKKA